MKHCCNCETSCNEESVVGLIICSVCARRTKRKNLELNKEIERLIEQKRVLMQVSLNLSDKNLELKDEVVKVKRMNGELRNRIESITTDDTQKEIQEIIESMGRIYRIKNR